MMRWGFNPRAEVRTHCQGPRAPQPQALLTRGSVWGRKEILREYLEISSLVQDEVVAIHREMAAAAARIQPEAEYQGFLQQYG